MIVKGEAQVLGIDVAEFPKPGEKRETLRRGDLLGPRVSRQGRGHLADRPSGSV